jgi:two-component system CheB/CheR fusion protein
LPHVFNRFSQEDGSSTRTYGGLGLGLAIVRHLVEAHGGTVTAESPGPGKGATFAVNFPLMAVPEEEREDEATPPRPGAPTRLTDLRILVVDDDPAICESLREMLGRAGADVRVTLSAQEAMSVLQEFQPDVLLCDIAMPGEDGYSLIGRVRDRGPGRGGDVPALALTALASAEDRLNALSAGFQMHLAKPVDVVRLTQAVAELARMREAGDTAVTGR